MRPWAAPAAADKINGPSGRGPTLAICPLPPSPTRSPLSLLPNRGTSSLRPPPTSPNSRRRPRRGQPHRAHHPRCRWCSTGAIVRDGGGAAEAKYRECTVLVIRACGNGLDIARGEDGRCVSGARAPRCGACSCLRRRRAGGREGRTLWSIRSSLALGRALYEAGLSRPLL
jgi:hypothetical protein